MVIGPFVPNRNLMLMQVLDIGVAAKEPKQFDQNALERCSFLVVSKGNLGLGRIVIAGRIDYEFPFRFYRI